MNTPPRRGWAARGISALALGWAAVTAQADPASRRPIELFASLPSVSHMVLAPDGQRYAALVNHGDRTTLVTRAVGGDKYTGVLASENKEYRVRWMRWVGADHLLVSVEYAWRRNFVGSAERRLLSVRADGTGKPRLVVPDPGVFGGRAPVQQLQDGVIDWMPDDGRHVMLQLPEAGRLFPAVYQVDVATGVLRMVKTPERDIHDWRTDSQHRVRIGIRTDGGVTEVRACDPDGSNWRTLWRYAGRQDAVHVMGFGQDPQELYIQAYHEGRQAVLTVRLDDPALVRTPRVARPDQDVFGELVRLSQGGEVIGVRYGVGDDGSHVDFWHPAWERQMKAVDLALPGRYNRLQQISLDQQRYLVNSTPAGGTSLYYLGDRQTGELVEIGSARPEFPASDLAGKTRVHFQARDGLQLQAHLTMPAGRTRGDAGPPLPMLLLPEGGVLGGYGPSFDPWTEFLADRGYAVLQVATRINGLYGEAVASSNVKAWGPELQDDVADAVAWAAAEKIADAGRVCVAGMGHGGHAALMGLLVKPGLFRCAVSVGGVSDLPDLSTHVNDYVLGREWAEAHLGKAWKYRERLRAASPARHVDRIQAPVLLVHGTSDRVFPVEQSRAMAKALARAGKPHRLLELEGADHWLTRYTHRLAFAEALDAFLAEHLAAPTAPDIDKDR